MPARWRFSILAALVIVGAVILVGSAWYPAIAPIDPRPGSFEPALIKKGAELALIGNCNTCHTKQDGAPYAGGRAIPTPFGTIHATNITPDSETGIGRWSEEAFARAMREGVRQDGAQLYPAFPYDHFTKLTGDDVRAIYAFLMTRDAVRAETPGNDLTFPFNIRAMVAGWKLLFFTPGEFQRDTGQSAEWNRGAYLVDALAHCGSCHTPRNALGAERRGSAFAGGETEGWIAPALNAASPAPTPWSSEQLATYLRTGYAAQHGAAAGPMQPVTNNLGRVSEDDVRAIAAYIGSMLQPATADRKTVAESTGTRQTTGSGAAIPAAQDASNAAGASLYAGACASCHERTGQRFSAQGLPLTLSKVLRLPDPQNLIHIIRDGIAPPDGAPAAMMPGFAGALTDEQVIALANYLRSNFTDQRPWTGVERAVGESRDRGS